MIKSAAVFFVSTTETSARSPTPLEVKGARRATRSYFPSPPIVSGGRLRSQGLDILDIKDAGKP